MWTVTQCTKESATKWVALRSLLWPQASEAEHGRDVAEMLTQRPKSIAFLACADGGEGIGFAEASLRTDHVNGCSSSPVAFLEGIYVREAYRRQGVARSLCATVEAWARQQNCSELASDSEISNAGSLAMHRALAFDETERVVFFRKVLAPTV